ncbi:MAG: hypothetical protein WBQ79_08060 [Acidobacteriaceae bacterium]
MAGVGIGGVTGAVVGSAVGATTHNNKEAAIPTEAVLTFTVD